MQSHCRSLSDIVRPYFLDLGEEDNKKRLSMVKNILKEQGTFSNEDALNLGIIELFAPYSPEKIFRLKSSWPANRNADYQYSCSIFF